MLKQLLDSPWTGAAGFLAAITWEAFWLVGPPLGLGGKDRKWYLFWGLIALLISGGQAFFVLKRENKSLTIELDEKQKIRKAREAIGKILEQIAQYELEAYRGSTSSEYDKLYQKIEQLKTDVKQVALEYLDASFESRFLAVNVHDIQLDAATRTHFIARTQGSFWTIYQQLKGWRACLVDILKELRC